MTDSGRTSSPELAAGQLCPDLRLCGSRERSFADFPDEVLAYVGLVLQDKPIRAVRISHDQWSEVLAALRSHWILPLFYWRLRSLPSDFQPPESIIDRLRRTFLQSRVSCMRMERQLSEILCAFQEEGVRALVLRGPGLGWTVYPDPALRPSSDIDLLVHPGQMVTARAVLQRLGYKCLGKRFEITRDFFREEEFIHRELPRENFPVDLHWIHWELHPFFKSSGEETVQDLFYRARQVEYSALSFETLHPVDAVIQGTIHATIIHKDDMRLIWLYDTVLLARQLRVPQDWLTLQERSVSWRARLPVEYGLRMAQVWFGLQLPEELSDFDKWPRPTEDELALWSNGSRHNWIAVLLKRALSNPVMFVRRLRSLLSLLIPPPEIVRYCYPVNRDWLLPLSYVRRWHRWFDYLLLKRGGSARHKG